MEADENTNVLDEVEILFKKLESLPENLKQAAFLRIQEKLPTQEKPKKYDGQTTAILKKKRVGRRKQITTTSEIGVIKDDPEWTSEDNETEYVVEDVLTRRGRRAKRISYVSLVQNNNRGREEVPDTAKQKNMGEIPAGEDSLAPKLENGNDSFTHCTEVAIECSSEKENSQGTDITRVKGESAENVKLLGKADTSVDGNETADVESKQNNAKDSVKQEVSNQKVSWRKRKVTRVGTLSCNECNFVTNSKTLLEVHSRRHTGIKPYVCPDCGKSFPHSSGLNVHMKRHRGQRDYPCDFCEYRAYTKVDKIRHMTIHTGERNQICQYCGKAFAKDSTLREHVRSIHERPFKHICCECGFTTYRANNLRVHVRMRHRGEYNNHVCPVCGAQVKQRNAFLEHMRAHTGEKPYRCEQCNSSFACLARLTVHRKSVHEPRKFPCKNCNKTFQTKHHLLRHMVIHTKAKPFPCPFCTYSCNTQGNMTKHVKTIHHMPHFSFRKYKADQEQEAKQVNPEWVEKGEKAMTEYLKELSKRLGRNVTLEELRDQENEKQKRLNQEIEQAKIRRMNRIHTPEHSYHSRVGKITPSVKADPYKSSNEEVDDPTTLILQVAAQNAADINSSAKEGDISQPQIVQVDVLADVENHSFKDKTSHVTPHIVQMLSSMNSSSSGSSRGGTKVIHIQASDNATDVKPEVEYEAVIFSEENNFVPTQVYQLVSPGQDVQLCFNGDFIESGDPTSVLEVVHEDKECEIEQYEALESNKEEIVEVAHHERINTEKECEDEEDTVVVIINTDSSQNIY